jgi:NAD(P)-dependent dehydrogenase (short-subunit alcohol dehydrogenase family)
MLAGKVALVTGSNKGIGKEIVRGLIPLFQTIVMTARNEELGLAALEELHGLAATHNCGLVFQQLDIADPESISRCRGWVGEQGGLDALVNNAGFAFKGAATEPFDHQAEVSVAINYTGTKSCCAAFLPLMRPGGRVVNVASMAGAIKQVSPALQAQFLDPSLSLDALDALLSAFVDATKAGNHSSQGWSNSAYGTSKLGVNMLTRILARDIELSNPGQDVVINCMCPGWCKSDMAGYERPPRSAAQGADTAIYLATLEKGTDVHGQFLSDRAPRRW